MKVGEDARVRIRQEQDERLVDVNWTKVTVNSGSSISNRWDKRLTGKGSKHMKNIEIDCQLSLHLP